MCFKGSYSGLYSIRTMEFLTHKNDDASALAEMSGTDCERRSVFMKPNTQGGGGGGDGGGSGTDRERCLEILGLG